MLDLNGPATTDTIRKPETSIVAGASSADGGTVKATAKSTGSWWSLAAWYQWARGKGQSAGTDVEIKFAVALALVLVPASAAAQPLPTTTPAPSYYEFAIFRPAVSMTTPFTVTRINLEIVSCGRFISERAPDGSPNPTTLVWDDPNDPTKECRVAAPTAILSLPLGTGYRAALRAVVLVDDILTGTKVPLYSAWAFDDTTFRRAPRGMPCPNGQPGTLFTTEADVNGKPVQLSACINAQ